MPDDLREGLAKGTTMWEDAICEGWDPLKVFQFWNSRTKLFYSRRGETKINAMSWRKGAFKFAS